MMSLTLGPVLFAGFELPAALEFGGQQTVAVHVLAGGARVIDVLGRDDSDITWDGILSGPDAVMRAGLLDSLRIGGVEQRLWWDRFDYRVVITECQLSYRKPWWIPYRIRCKVVQDQAWVPPVAEMTAQQRVVTDIGAAGGLIDLEPITALAASGSDLNALIRARDRCYSDIINADIAVAANPVSDPLGVIACTNLANLSAAQGFLDRAVRGLAA